MDRIVLETLLAHAEAFHAEMSEQKNGHLEGTVEKEKETRRVKPMLDWPTVPKGRIKSVTNECQPEIQRLW